MHAFAEAEGVFQLPLLTLLATRNILRARDQPCYCNPNEKATGTTTSLRMRVPRNAAIYDIVRTTD